MRRAGRWRDSTPSLGWVGAEHTQMSNKAILLQRYQLASEVDEPAAALSYLQLRNREALRAWQMRLAQQQSAARAGAQQQAIAGSDRPYR